MKDKNNTRTLGWTHGQTLLFQFLYFEGSVCVQRGKTHDMKQSTPAQNKKNKKPTVDVKHGERLTETEKHSSSVFPHQSGTNLIVLMTNKRDKTEINLKQRPVSNAHYSLLFIYFFQGLASLEGDSFPPGVSVGVAAPSSHPS